MFSQCCDKDYCLQMAVPPNNRIQRAGTHKVLSRGRGRAAAEQVMRARVPTSRRAGADAGRWATAIPSMRMRRATITRCARATSQEPALTIVANCSPENWRQHGCQRYRPSDSEEPLV
jgi:pyruvate/2-oxoglutarate dehydrogenase complex dihydrolipoamide acyltransferase (E2) component